VDKVRAIAQYHDYAQGEYRLHTYNRGEYGDTGWSTAVVKIPIKKLYSQGYMEYQQFNNKETIDAEEALHRMSRAASKAGVTVEQFTNAYGSIGDAITAKAGVFIADSISQLVIDGEPPAVPAKNAKPGFRFQKGKKKSIPFKTNHGPQRGAKANHNLKHHR